VLDDVDFAVINKAPGQVVHPGRTSRRHVGRWTTRLYPEMRDLSEMDCVIPWPGYRAPIGQGDVGVLVVAKTPEGFSNLSIQLAERLMERTYYGMVEGHVAEERGIVDAPIGRSTRTRPSWRCVRTAGQRARVTRSSHASRNRTR